MGQGHPPPFTRQLFDHRHSCRHPEAMFVPLLCRHPFGRLWAPLSGVGREWWSVVDHCWLAPATLVRSMTPARTMAPGVYVDAFRKLLRDGAAALVNCSLNGAASSGIAAELRRQRAGPSRAAGVCRRGVGWTCVHRGGRANVAALGRLSRLKGPTVLWIWVRQLEESGDARTWGAVLDGASTFYYGSVGAVLVLRGASVTLCGPPRVGFWVGWAARSRSSAAGGDVAVRVGGWRRCACSAVPATVAAGREMDIGGEGDGVVVGTVVAGNKEATTRM
ncbi:hypothetical protein BJ912DRAFT_930224 [Pholiota molesta]|nr:hypothetical protein BJ912DRAFT_930224 [Pholiota molesta]